MRTIDEQEQLRAEALNSWIAELRRDDGQPAVETRHTCLGCGEILAVCQHADYSDFKRCARTLKALCDQCAG